MNSLAATHNPFPRKGGPLDVYHPTYIVRKADLEVLENILLQNYCYILTPRQMGKTSLAYQLTKNLENQGFLSVYIDLEQIISQTTTEEQLFLSILNQLTKKFNLITDLNNMWIEQSNLYGPIYSFNNFIEEVLLKKIKKNIIILIDEIDMTLRMDSHGYDLFTSIRGFYNQRYRNPEYKRLTFCLLGVASPSDLIQDKNVTPFNIGVPIQLEGFALDEVKQYIKYFKKCVSNPEQTLEKIIYWTGGQPFLTQKLCYFVLDEIKKKGIKNPDVKKIVQERIINHWETQDRPEHLKTIRRRILKNEDQPFFGHLLNLYQKILNGETISADDSRQQTELKLSGLVVNNKGKLEVSNPIYKKVFDLAWIDQVKSSFKSYWNQLIAWSDSNKKEDMYLIYGEELKKAWDNVKKQDLTDNKEWNFLTKSQECYEKALLSIQSNHFQNPHAIIDAVYYWTRRQKELFDKLISLINKTSSIPADGEEKQWVDKLVHLHFINKWETNEDAAHLTEVANGISNLEESDCFQILQLYQLILNHDEITVDNNNKYQKIIVGTGLVLKINTYLEVSNRIYKEVFNAQWLEQKSLYGQLRQFLIEKKWKEADQETAEIMLKVSSINGTEKKEYLDEQDIKQFPCEVLQKIDRLWLEYSQERFGFTIQRRIWESVGGEAGYYDPEIASKFAESVCWYDSSKEKWLSWFDFTFSLKAKQQQKGLLPTPPPSVSRQRVNPWAIPTLASRLKSCQCDLP